MTLVLPNCAIFHIRKTGGSWVRSAIYRSVAGVSDAPCNKCAAESAQALSECCYHASPLSAYYNPTHKLGITFVRHPVDIYRSQWAYNHKHNRWAAEQHFGRFDHDCFACSIEYYTKHHPGLVTSIFSEYGAMYTTHLGPVGFVGRQEHLADDLVRALRLAGQNFNEELLRSTPPVNKVLTSGSWQEHTTLNKKLWNKLVESEKESLNHFGYTTDFDAYQAGERFASQ